MGYSEPSTAVNLSLSTAVAVAKILMGSNLEPELYHGHQKVSESIIKLTSIIKKNSLDT